MNKILIFSWIALFVCITCLRVLSQELFKLLPATDSSIEGVEITKGVQAGEYKIVYSGKDSVFVKIIAFQVQADDCTLNYKANMRSEENTEKAYIEMICYLNNIPYFSKALNQVFTGEKDWTPVSTPFFLKKNQIPEKVVLGVRFEGPGIVRLKDIRMDRGSTAGITGYEKWAWLPGTLFGVLAGLYGSFVGFAAPRGKARLLVYGLGIFFIILSIIMFVTGIVFLIVGMPYGLWYGLLLPGILGIILIPSMLYRILKVYEMAETRKIQAHDALDG